MEVMKRRAHSTEDDSDAERQEVEIEEATREDVIKERLLKVVVKLGAISKMDIPMYEVNLDA
jgi:hypothetical protein